MLLAWWLRREELCGPSAVSQGGRCWPVSRSSTPLSDLTGKLTVCFSFVSFEVAQNILSLCCSIVICPSTRGSPFKPGPAQGFLLLKAGFLSASVACWWSDLIKNKTAHLHLPDSVIPADIWECLLLPVSASTIWLLPLSREGIFTPSRGCRGAHWECSVHDSLDRIKLPIQIGSSIIKLQLFSRKQTEKTCFTLYS